jgi:CRISPR-associated endonuclease/helicase Cas3
VPIDPVISHLDCAAVPRPFAHSRVGEGEDRWEPLEKHLRDVAQLAEQFAEAFQSGAWGYLAGLWHDLGKYRPEFQRRLRGSREQVEHAGLGAALAMSKGRAAGLPLAFVIAGHHAGLANWQAQGETSQQPLVQRVTQNEPVLGQLSHAIPPAITTGSLPGLPPFLLAVHATSPESQRCRFELWTRFLFSALVDADRLATEAFDNPDRSVRRAVGFSPITELYARLEKRLAQFAPDTPVNRLRARVLTDCRDAAKLAPGVFSLTAPTGAGKTLSAMAFALRHAELHDLRRVIVVLPYTSIIEQNAAVYAEALGDANVVEHHANVDSQARCEVNSELEIRRELATENWNAPVIVTTTVQFFESLFANQPSRCRKLHNVARSVVILDEAQALPSGYLSCLLDVMRELVAVYGCSIVISTATQPALGKRDTLPGGLEGVREIIREPQELAAALNRVELQWPEPEEPPMTHAELAGELARHERVLVIVHLRRDARRLAEQLPEEGRFHLSALMCPAHRAATLARIRATLKGDGPCRVVATQLVEAGVDLDFPVVYRALAGLDSLAQAAGRCNREGRLAKGMVRVFRAESKPPPGVLQKGLESTEALLGRYGNGLDVLEGKFFNEYFRILYGKCDTDHRGVQAERERLNFATVSGSVQLIEDGYSHPVVVPWGDAADRVSRFAAEPSRQSQRALQPYVVQVYGAELRILESLGAVELVNESIHVLQPAFHGLYDEAVGLVVEESAQPDPSVYIVSG